MPVSEHPFSSSLLSAFKDKLKILVRAGSRFVAGGKRLGSTARYKAVDKKLVFSLNKSKVPTLRQLKYIRHFLSTAERRIIRLAFLVIAVSAAAAGINIYRNHIVLVPARGGSYTEVLTGTPKFINPLYSSINTVDSDLVSLVYSGLLKRNARNELVADLAEGFTVNDDGKIYTFNLKKDVRWHDGNLFSADDVVFTFSALVNPEYSSPLQRNYSGVAVAKVDDHTVTFSLAEPYAAFLELLTVGILPAAVWQQIPPSATHLAELTLKPIGTGPYMFDALTKDAKTGAIRSYELKGNETYFGQPPYISKLIFKFSPSFQESASALNEGRAEGVDYLPPEQAEILVTKNNYALRYLQQPQFTALFFNQSNLGGLQDVRVKQALAHALNKTSFVKDLKYANVVDGPILPLFGDYYKSDIKRYEYDLSKAAALLDESGWREVEVAKTEAGADGESADENGAETAAPEPGIWRKKEDSRLEINITTVDQPETVALAGLIKESWEALHIKVTVTAVPPQQMQADVIRPRDYQALLYGIVLGFDPDQYPFWHSSQISANGLNFSNYNNKKVDELLEDGRITSDTALRKDKYYQLQDIIANDLPAIFLYSQRYTYLQTKNIQGFDVQSITVQADRFSNITDWYIKTKKKFVFSR